MIATTGRADLLRALLEGGEEGLRSMAGVLGYEEERQAPATTAEPPPAAPRAAPVPRATPTTPSPPTTPEASLPPRPIPYWRVVRTEPNLADADRLGIGPPLPDIETEPLGEADLEASSGADPPRTPPITPWPRLWRWLDDRLRTHRPRRELDIPRLVELWARGEEVERLPRLAGLVHCRLRVLIDRSRELLPFHLDQLDLLDRLEQRLGTASVRVADWREPELATLGDDEQVLALGDLGTLGDGSQGRLRRQHWQDLGEQAGRQGAKAHALVLGPSRHLSAQLARIWRAASWVNPTGASGTRPVTAKEAAVDSGSARVEQVLRLAALATRLERGLLRELVRRVPGTGPATEARVWVHPAVKQRTPRALVLDAEASRRWLEDFAEEVPREQQKAAVEVLRRWHAETLPEVWAEEVARMLALGLPEAWLGEEAVAWAAELFAKVAASVERDPGDDELALGTESFFLRLDDRASDRLRRHPHFYRSFVRALTALRARDRLPEASAGSLPEALPATEEPREPEPWTLRQTAEGLRFFRGTAHDSQGEGSWLATFRSRGGEVRVGDGVARDRRMRLGMEMEPFPWSFDRQLLRVTSDVETVTLEPWIRPDWASRAGRDGYGLWAAFEVGGVEQRMRWIPPGRFTMGSPEDEEGRWDDEGPRHEVVLNEGYWLAETPCTQALWEVVMGENPSDFPAPRRPVELVSWNDCQRLVDRLGFRFRDLEVQLPSEAEWEVACRAGAIEATWQGDLEILGESDAPILDPVAWYGGNSGVDYEGPEGRDSSRWPEKQHPHERAGTREVARKAPNPWGLYDLLGNVWEWCWDFKGPYGEGARIDPEGPEQGKERSFRGGSWDAYARRVRAAYRGWGDPANRYHNLGFRLARAPSVRRSRSWVERLGWAADGGLDEYGRWVAIEVGGVRHRLRWIYPGTFWMGSPEDEEGRYLDEGSRHEVTLTQGFWLGETPCTQALWEAVMGNNPSNFKSPDRPVEQLRWEECQEFFEQLAKQVPGFVARLPTEAQWEYACRAGTQFATWQGNVQIRGERDAPLLADLAWYGGNSGVAFDLLGGVDSSRWKEKQYPHMVAGTREVGQKAANPWGLYDMLGNVCEWCEDTWDLNEGYPGGARIDPLDAEGFHHVYRGGSWGSRARLVRAACRNASHKGFFVDYLGFRLSRGPEEDWLAEPQKGSGAGPGAADRGTREKRAPGSAERGESPRPPFPKGGPEGPG